MIITMQINSHNIDHHLSDNDVQNGHCNESQHKSIHED